MQNIAFLILMHGKGLVEKESEYNKELKFQFSHFYSLFKKYKGVLVTETCKKIPIYKYTGAKRSHVKRR